MTDSDNEVLIRVNNVSKKFCRDFKKSLWYGLKDTASDIFSINSKEQERELTHLREGEFWANQNVSFELKRGECLGLIGHNGAGKTTLLKLLNGLIKPDTGRIEIKGKIGALIALGSGFNPILTGRENIYVNGSILGLSKKEIDDKLEDIIEFAEVADAIDSPVRTYSSGMNVRLGFSVAVKLLNPDILILDEILAVGDVSFSTKCLNLIRDIVTETAVIMVSHNIQTVSQFSTKVILLNKGIIELETKEVNKAIERYLIHCVRRIQIGGTKEVVSEKEMFIINGKMINQEYVKINSNDKVQINFRIIIEKKIHNAYCKLAIKANNGTQLCTYFFNSKENTDKLKDSGHYDCKLDLGNLNLVPGKYHILLIFAGDKNEKIYLRKEGILPFQVIGDEEKSYISSPFRFNRTSHFKKI